jgi:hypothetical protein
MSVREPETVEELCIYIARYADSILVHQQVGGKRKSVALSKLPTKEALERALGWVAEGSIPHRKLGREEVRENAARTSLP